MNSELKRGFITDLLNTPFLLVSFKYIPYGSTSFVICVSYALFPFSLIQSSNSWMYYVLFPRNTITSLWWEEYNRNSPSFSNSVFVDGIIFTLLFRNTIWNTIPRSSSSLSPSATLSLKNRRQATTTHSYGFEANSYSPESNHRCWWME